MTRVAAPYRFSADDVLYVLGDAIDRYPDGLAVLQDIMCRPNVHMLLGNHEAMMLTTLSSGRSNDIRLWVQNGGRRTYDAAAYELSPEERMQILQYLQTLPDYIEITVNGRDFYLVHGYIGDTTHDRVWGRPEPLPEAPPMPGKTVIVGHTCTFFLRDDYDENCPFEILQTPGLIAIDCGCGNETDLRRLACLRLDDMQEFYV